MSLNTQLKRILPKQVLNLRHFFYAWLGAVVYRHPSEELFVIGVTGTSGKSSTIYFLRQILEQAGFVVGSLSTIDFYIAGEDKLNDQKMTMLGKMAIQRYLREMVRKRCDIAIVETTSEGAVQHRHRFINYDMMILTNLYPEHIESHGSFENYKGAKLGILNYVSKSKRKQIKNLKNLSKHTQKISGKVPKTVIVNGNTEYVSEFLQFHFDQKMTFGSDRTKIFSSNQKNTDENFVAKDIHSDKTGLIFSVSGHHFRAPLFGEHNIHNIVAALAVLRALQVGWEVLQDAISQLQSPPGRIEFIKEAEAYGFQVVVDYAFEPVAMQKLYDVADLLQPKRIIHVFGSTGGGRDAARRFTVGEFIGSRADICVVTDEDPYDDNPLEIIADVVRAVKKVGKQEGKDLYITPDRSDAIRYALDAARPGDLVLITGKGSEQGMVKKGKLIPWDDREVVRDYLQNK